GTTINSTSRVETLTHAKSALSIIHSPGLRPARHAPAESQINCLLVRDEAVLQGAFAGFARTYPYRLLYRGDKNLAVADLARVGCGTQVFDGLLHQMF